MYNKIYLPIANNSLILKVDLLYKRKIINSNMMDLITSVTKVCNIGIHGEIINDDYIEFVMASTPSINDYLDRLEIPIEKKDDPSIDQIECFRCGYQGERSFGNRCPKCGAYLDD